MTEFARLTQLLGWSCAYTARRLGVSSQTCERYHSGRNSAGNPCQPPDDVIEWLRLCVAVVDAIPQPYRYPQAMEKRTIKLMPARSFQRP
jgi:hypothetical protein